MSQKSLPLGNPGSSSPHKLDRQILPGTLEIVFLDKWKKVHPKIQDGKYSLCSSTWEISSQ